MVEGGVIGVFAWVEFDELEGDRGVSFKEGIAIEEFFGVCAAGYGGACGDDCAGIEEVDVEGNPVGNVGKFFEDFGENG